MNLKKIRTERNLTVKQLSEMTGLCALGIYNWEKGKTKPNQISIYKLMSALNCTYEELTKGE